jgi:ribosomal protein L35
MKPNKSILKRIRVTKNGKLIRRISGQNHFNSKENRRAQRRKRATTALTGRIARGIKRLI